MGDHLIQGPGLPLPGDGSKQPSSSHGPINFEAKVLFNRGIPNFDENALNHELIRRVLGAVSEKLRGDKSSKIVLSVTRSDFDDGVPEHIQKSELDCKAILTFSPPRKIRWKNQQAVNDAIADLAKLSAQFKK